MILTTATAREKECHKDKSVNCSADECMAWRWAEDWHARAIRCEIKRAESEPERPANVPASYLFIAADPEMDAAWFESTAEAMERRRGYCGLAGIPFEIKGQDYR